MSEVNFYETGDEPIVKSIAPLLQKILEEGKKALIFCEDQKKLEELDKSIWSYGRTTFIAHITENDNDFNFDRQPIILTSKEENLNKADYLIFLIDVQKQFLKSFKRSFFFFEEGENFSKFKPDNYFRKEGGKWLKVKNLG